MEQLVITGYERDSNCEHCGRRLRHGIRLHDGRVVGATCLDKKLTKPRKYQGKAYRFGPEYIIRIAKVVQNHPSDTWPRFGVSICSTVFEASP